MASVIKLYERAELRNPILIEGVPGMGFVASIVATHIIRSLKAKKLGEISSPFFQDIAFSTTDGNIRPPIMELYYWKSDGSNDLIVLYGNTQALTSYGQYELCGKILDVTQDVGCKLVVCVGGLGRDSVVGAPAVYCTATDFETLDGLMKHGLHIVQGRIFGMSGILLGLARMRGVKGFCLLAETTGVYPDMVAAKTVLEKLNTILGLNIELVNLEKAVEDVNRAFEPLRGS